MKTCKKAWFINPPHEIYVSDNMAQSTVMAIAAAFIVLGILAYVPSVTAGMPWIIAGVVAFVAGWATKNMK